MVSENWPKLHRRRSSSSSNSSNAASVGAVGRSSYVFQR